MTEETKGTAWVLEQLENISEAMIPTDTCMTCKGCPEFEFDNRIAAANGIGTAMQGIDGCDPPGQCPVKTDVIMPDHILYVDLGRDGS